MIVSWEWLKDYLPLKESAEAVVHRLMMAGLNHEGTQPVGNDLAIDLEVTSNRPDCLGHVGIAREISVLFDLPLQLPAATPRESPVQVGSLAKVRIDCPSLCPRYLARVIRGVKVGKSPDWLASRLATLGITVINNVVDVTNYVMMECGQPLHAFDFDRLRGHEIIVRAAKPDEMFLAIDHRTYKLDPTMCVIADAQLPVALGGVMGGAESEVSEHTRDVLIEAAAFSPMSIRSTARKLNLHSPSSYRFERGVDVHGLEWASRRCCELILATAGGELTAGVVATGEEPAPPGSIILRFSQLPRVLGIDVPVEVVRRILAALGLRQVSASAERVEVIPPTWRRDLTREIDLVEEVARVYGYDRIPEDAAVPMCPSFRRDEDRVLSQMRGVMTAAGFDEALTASVVPHEWCSAFSPWTDAAPLSSQLPMLKGADRLRLSLIPSLLEARRVNESVANSVIELFETARIYLARDGELPYEQRTLGITSGADFLTVKGIVESLVERLHVTVPLSIEPMRNSFLESDSSCELWLGGQRLGFVGPVTAAGLKQFGLRNPTTIAEVSIDVLEQFARLVPKYVAQSPYPAMTRDLNLIVDEAVRWADLAATVRGSGGEMLESLTYQETYRDPQKDGADKKRLLFSFSLRSPDRTLTGEEADQVRDGIVAACGKQHNAKLLA